MGKAGKPVAKKFIAAFTCQPKECPCPKLPTGLPYGAGKAQQVINHINLARAAQDPPLPPIGYDTIQDSDDLKPYCKALDDKDKIPISDEGWTATIDQALEWGYTACMVSYTSYVCWHTANYDASKDIHQLHESKVSNMCVTTFMMIGCRNATSQTWRRRSTGL